MSSKAIITQSHLTDIANAIIAKDGGAAMTPAQMSTRIAAISTGDYPREWNHRYSEVTIDLTDATGWDSFLLTVPWSIEVIDQTKGVWIDYGDGSQVETLVGNGIKNLTHTYATPGVYTIRIDAEQDGLSWAFDWKGVVYFSNNINQRQGLPWMRRITGVGIGTTCRYANNQGSGSLQFIGNAWVCINNANTSSGVINTYTNPSWMNECRAKYLSKLKDGVYFGVGTGMYFNDIDETITISSNPSFSLRSYQGMKKLVIGNAVTALPNLFAYQCFFLREIEFGTGLLTFGVQPFFGCDSLHKVKINSVMTSYGTGIGTFQACTALTSVDLGYSACPILSRMFYRCVCLKNLVMRSSTMVSLANVDAFCEAGIAELFYGGTSTDGKCTIHVPSNLVSAYEADSNWAAAIAVGNIQFTALQEGE